MKSLLTDEELTHKSLEIIRELQTVIQDRLRNEILFPNRSCPLTAGLAYHNWISETYVGFGANMMNLANAVAVVGYTALQQLAPARFGGIANTTAAAGTLAAKGVADG